MDFSFLLGTPCPEVSLILEGTCGGLAFRGRLELFFFFSFPMNSHTVGAGKSQEGRQAAWAVSPPHI
jgi:hypothetical protein